MDLAQFRFRRYKLCSLPYKNIYTYILTLINIQNYSHLNWYSKCIPEKIRYLLARKNDLDRIQKINSKILNNCVDTYYFIIIITLNKIDKLYYVSTYNILVVYILHLTYSLYEITFLMQYINYNKLHSKQLKRSITNIFDELFKMRSLELLINNYEYL